MKLEAITSHTTCASLLRQVRLNAILLLFATFVFGLSSPEAHAKPSNNSLNVIPTITSITLQGGQLVASGTASAVIKGKRLFMKGEPETVAAVCDRRADGADTAPLQKSVRRVKPLLYVYRVLLTGIRLMRTGEIEANLITLNEVSVVLHRRPRCTQAGRPGAIQAGGWRHRIPRG